MQFNSSLFLLLIFETLLDYSFQICIYRHTPLPVVLSLPGVWIKATPHKFTLVGHNFTLYVCFGLLWALFGGATKL